MSIDTSLSEVSIENLTDWLRSLRLNSGTVLHLPPRETSQAIAGVEVQNNAEVEKLVGRHAIAIHKLASPETKQKAGSKAATEKKADSDPEGGSAKQRGTAKSAEK
jgi:hypothetical protein